jgi:hypothetical protein
VLSLAIHSDAASRGVLDPTWNKEEMTHYYVSLDANNDGNLIVKPTGRTISLELFVQKWKNTSFEYLNLAHKN